MNVLVCGGAGYIGSHTVSELLDQNYSVVVLDNLENGHIQAVSPDAKLVICDLRDKESLNKLFLENKIDAVIDFAAYSLVGESVSSPLKYYENNVYGTLNLLEAMKNNDVNHIVFSSTAATYGEPKNIPILETDDTNPTSPYGETKLAVEKMLHWADNAYGLKFAALRYFNVAGAHISGKIGEDHKPETHLIPNIIKVALGQKEDFSLFGNDYDTPDGTCIRDYIHVTDLAKAHILALNKIINDNESKIYNLGNGKGFSNKEILDEVIKISKVDIPYTIEPRRSGDPARLVASSEKAVNELGWKPEYSELSQIIESAWNWHKNNPYGFSDSL